MSLFYMFFSQAPVLSMLGFAFWIWMIYDCMTNERDRYTWVWILIILNVIGAGLYFFARARYRYRFGVPESWNPAVRKRKLWQAEADVRNIGNAHQYVALAEVLVEQKEIERAKEAYRSAIEKEPGNPKALWGVATLELKQKDLVNVKQHLQMLLKVRPDFNYGEASMIYGETLVELKELGAAKEHLEEHVRNWSSPSAYLLLGKVHELQGNTSEAHRILEDVIIRGRGAPGYHYKRNQPFVKQAEKRLKGLKV
jgi:hypothetical protein